MSFNFDGLRDKVRDSVNLNDLRSTLTTNLTSLRENVTTNAPRLGNTLRTKLTGYVPAPTSESSSSSSAPGSTPTLAHVATAPARVNASRDVEAQDQQGLLSDLSKEVTSMCSLSRTQSIQAFAVCFFVGILLILLSFISLSVGNITPFAVFYSFGNVLSFASSFFLVGPRQHLATMSQEGRAVASGIAVLSIILTLCAAFWWRIKILVLVFAITEFCAMFWYSLTYIPYGRTILKSLFGRCMTSLEDG